MVVQNKSGAQTQYGRGMQSNFKQQDSDFDSTVQVKKGNAMYISNGLSRGWHKLAGTLTQTSPSGLICYWSSYKMSMY